MGRKKVADKLRGLMIGFRESEIKILSEDVVKKEAKEHIKKLSDERKKEIQARELQQKGQ